MFRNSLDFTFKELVFHQDLHSLSAHFVTPLARASKVGYYVDDTNCRLIVLILIVPGSGQLFRGSILLSSNVLFEIVLMDEGFNLILQLEVFFCVMTVVMVQVTLLPFVPPD